MEKILEGSLARFEVPDILTFLNLGLRTGVLVFERPEYETKLFFREGSPLYATSTKPALRFGTLLERLGKVSSDQLERVLQRQRTEGHRIGQVLLWEKILAEGELAYFLKVQVSEVIFDTFTWHTGVFGFYDGVPAPGTAVTLEMNVQNLIMEGVRRIDERAQLSEVFPRLDMVVEVVANPERVKQSVTLTREEWQVFFLIDGRRSLDEICRAAGNPDELATLQILYHLLIAKFVALHPPHLYSPQAHAADVEADGTQHLGARGEPHSGKVSVAFGAHAPAQTSPDDASGILNPKAMKYLQDAKKVTVSRLILVRDDGETSFPLMRDSYALGRHRNNDILISDSKVSSFHARIDRSSEGFVLVDLKSRNGTFLNGKKIESGLLKTGDEVRLGTARLIYKVDYTSAV
ncbi:MAG TPA: DUF4388 domain-containing protein [Vicinamibacteria bacterium]|jgi:hypothetical protein|nr:DUF4388 domain-containing protein [Vicinamibacteria bacterium]